MIIDCHGHYTTAPPQLSAYRKELLTDSHRHAPLPSAPMRVSDDQIRQSLEDSQLRLQRERGIDVTIFSPRASAMAHDEGGLDISLRWAEACNDLIYRVCELYPTNFVGACQLPQSPGISPETCVRELHRCVEDLGFVACNLNPDPSGGYWVDPPLTDEWWFPLYEAMVELDVPAMVHVSRSRNANFHTTGGHYLAADTTVFMQLLESRLFERFPKLRFVIPHGGGAVPFHWGRFRGLAADNGFGDLEESVLGNIFFDTCVYHFPGIRLLFDVIPIENILFASEMFGAVRGVDTRSGIAFDDTKRYIEMLDLKAGDAFRVFEGNARKVYPRLEDILRPRSGAVTDDGDVSA